MLLKAFHQQLINDRERTYLTAAAAAAATTLTVADTDLAPAATSSDTWSDNDYMLIGNFGEETAEVMQMSAAVTSATSLTIDRSGQSGGLRFAHPIGTPVYRLDYNRVEFGRSATDATSGVSVLTTIRIRPNELFTQYDDTTNTTGYGFIRFNNETGSTFSSYSDGVNYEATGERASNDPRTLWMLRKKVRELLDEKTESKLKDARIDSALNDKQRDIAHQRLWSFYEVERSFSLVANQFAYDIPSTVQKVHAARVDTQPLVPINKTLWDVLHYDTNTSSADTSHICVWNNQILLYPRPSSASSTTALNGAITAAATTITVDATSTFNRGDYYRFIIDSEVIYATNSTSTTFTGCLRGREGTTAATHSDDATVTERDLVYTAHVEPTDLLDTQDRTAIPEPEVLALGAAIELAPFVGKQDLLTNYEARFARKLKELESKYAVKQSAYFGRVKPARSVTSSGQGILQNPNDYPRSITGS